MRNGPDLGPYRFHDASPSVFDEHEVYAAPELDAPMGARELFWLIVFVIGSFCVLANVVALVWRFWRAL